MWIKDLLFCIFYYYIEVCDMINLASQLSSYFILYRDITAVLMTTDGLQVTLPKSFSSYWPKMGMDSKGKDTIAS